MSLLPLRSALGILLGATFLLALAWPRPTAAQEPGKFYLSWHAPYGHPRSRDQLSVACGDSSQRDTLYLTFDPGRDSTELVAVDAELRLIPARGDTLERHWWFESLSNPANLTADFNLENAPGARRIWEAMGAGGVRTVSGPKGAVIRLVWAVRPADVAVVHGGSQYAFARIVIPRPGNVDDCAHPVCIELVFGRLAFDVQDEHFVRDGRRWLSWNPGDQTPCAESIRKSRLAPWRPAGK